MSNPSSLPQAGTIALTLLVLFASGSSCDPARNTGPATTVSAALPQGPIERTRISAAGDFTSRYKRSRLSDWNIRAHAAGSGCNVLVVQMPVIMEDSMIEAMHYGTGAYGVVEGGVQHFYRQHDFRGVVYRDGSDRIWTYGVSDDEAKTLAPCR